MPRTKIGKWTVGLLLLFSLFVLAGLLMRRPGHGFDQIGVPYICAAALGIAIFVTALIGLFMKKDRAFLVVFCAVVGLFVSLTVIFIVIGGMTYRPGQ